MRYRVYISVIYNKLIHVITFFASNSPDLIEKGTCSTFKTTLWDMFD